MTLVKWSNGTRSNENPSSLSTTPSFFNTRSLLDSLRNPYDSMRLFQNLLDDDLGFTTGNIGRNIPAVNISENNDAITIEVAAPGMKKKDFGIEINNNQLTISYRKESQNKDKSSKNMWRQEYNFESFERTFSLPDSINADMITAKYEDGILHIIAPKKEEARQKPSRSVEVK